MHIKYNQNKKITKFTFLNLFVFFVILSMLVPVLPTLSIVSSEESWVRIYGGENEGITWVGDQVIDDLGNVYVTGRFGYEASNKEVDILTLKYDPDGNLEWVATYNGPSTNGYNSFDDAWNIDLDSSGNVIVVGFNSNTGPDTSTISIVTIKYDNNGIEQWVELYTNQWYATATSFIIDDEDNIYISGFTSDSTTGRDFITLKYDQLGNLLWDYSFKGPGNSIDIAYDIALDSIGNVIVTGSNQYDLTSEITTIKYSKDGAVLWTAVFQAAEGLFYSVRDLAIDSSGNIFISGNKVSYDVSTGVFGNSDFFTLKYYPSGILLYEVIHDENYYDSFTSMEIDSQDNVILTGYSRSSVQSEVTSLIIIKYNNNGLQQWINRYNSPVDGQSVGLWDLAIDQSNNIYIVGSIYNSVENIDIITIMYSYSGELQWAQTYDGPAGNTDVGRSIVVDSLGNIYVSGYTVTKASNQVGYNFSYLTIKYVNQDPSIFVFPSIYNYGDVEVGTSSDAIITISNNGASDLIISSLVILHPLLQVVWPPGFGLSAPQLPIVIPPGGFRDIIVTFTPLSERVYEAYLQITHDDSNSPQNIRVDFIGRGVPNVIPPDEEVANTLEIFDNAVQTGSIVGSGKGQSGERRLNALRNMIEAASTLITSGDYEAAIQQLMDVYRRTDGETNPPDFIRGEDAVLIANMILDLINILEALL